jgi:Tol biopolymer transport system component
MKPTLCFALIAAFVLICFPSFAQQNNKAENLYQEGLMQMEGRGNYQKALEIFGRIMKEFANDRRAAAKAQFQTGVCYEKLGKAEAQKAYEQTIAKYPDQADLVAQARARLSALGTAMEAGRGPVAHRVLSHLDMGISVYDIYPSRDGRRVAYVNGYDGSLHVCDLASGDDQLVAPWTSGYRYSPRWSPDGKRLAVMEHNDTTEISVVKLIDVATRNVVTVTGTESRQWKEPVEWSRDGQFLLCGSDRSFMVMISTGAVTVLPDVPWAQALSPDGRYVAFKLGKGEDAQAYVQPLAGGTRQKIAQAMGGDDPSMCWSPDGRAIAYQHKGGIWIVPMSNGSASGPPRLALSTPRIRLWAWTDAGLFYTLWPDIDKGRTLCQIEMDPVTGEARAGGMQKLPATVPEGTYTFAWSPDMRRIVFRLLEQNAQKIPVYSVESKTLTTYGIGEEGCLGAEWWTADSREIQFGYRDKMYVPEAQFKAMSLDLSSGKVRQLFSPRRDWLGFSVTPDGHRMAYFRRKVNNTYVALDSIIVAPFGSFEGKCVADINGGVTGFAMISPKISPKGDKVIFARQEYPGGNAAFPYNKATLWIVNSDGSNLRKLATLTYVKAFVLDPSGRFVAYSGKADSGRAAASVLRVVDVATGAERDVPLEKYRQNDLVVSDWSSNGRYLAISLGPHVGDDAWLEEHPEFWVVQGLQEKVR